jgi:hypothetical protein
MDRNRLHPTTVSKRTGTTRLYRCLRDNDIKPNTLADVTGISRQHLLRLRKGMA